MKFLRSACEQPPRGTFLIKRELPKRGFLDLFNVTETAADAMESVFIAAEEWGATDHAGPEGCARFETLQVAGQISPAMFPQHEKGVESAVCDAIWSIAEIMRVIIAGAVIAAKDDCAEGDSVVIAHRLPPGFHWDFDDDTQAMNVEGRCRIGVYLKSRPDLSYLLGTLPGETSHHFGWIAPSDMVSGPDRLHFLDNRSPGHVEQEQLIQVAS
jgi:hypothetical protein